MEIILKQDVVNLGLKDDIVTVKNGYARNFLIPQKLAVLATPSAKKVLAENLRQRAHKEEKIIADAKETQAKLEALKLTLRVKSGEQGKLFGSISSADLTEEFVKNGIAVDKKYIRIPGTTIKKLGSYTAKVRLHREVEFEFNFEVVAAE